MDASSLLRYYPISFRSLLPSDFISVLEESGSSHTKDSKTCNQKKIFEIKDPTSGLVCPYVFNTEGYHSILRYYNCSSDITFHLLWLSSSSTSHLSTLGNKWETNLPWRKALRVQKQGFRRVSKRAVSWGLPSLLYNWRYQNYLHSFPIFLVRRAISLLSRDTDLPVHRELATASCC